MPLSSGLHLGLFSELSLRPRGPALLALFGIDETNQFLDVVGDPLSENFPGLLEGFPFLKEVVVSECAIEIHVVGKADESRHLP